MGTVHPIPTLVTHERWSVASISVGAYIAGRLSDKEVIKWRKHRGGEWVPEDRLRVTLIGALVYVPLSILLSGIATEYVEGTAGISTLR